MKIINKKYLTIEELEKDLDLTHFKTKNTLIQIFSGFIHKEQLIQIQQIIKHKRDDITFIGTTTAGEIYNGEVVEKSIVISIVEFENTTIQGGFFSDEDDFALGVSVASELCKKDTKAMILFVDGITTNGNDLINGITSINNSIPLAGGMAGEDGGLEHIYIFDQDGVYQEGCVCVALHSQELHVYTHYQLNWQAIGRVMEVTKVYKDRVYELDGVNITQMYTKYLGENIGKNLPYSAVEFPLLKKEPNGVEVCRTFIHQFEDGSLLAIGNLEVGDKVRFSFGNVDLIIKTTKKSLLDEVPLNPEVIFVYSCAARKSLLESQISKELKPLNKIAPNVGFFTYGEIFHTQENNFLLNESFTMLALSENNKIVGKKSSKTYYEDIVEENQLNNFLKDKRFWILDALTHLSNTVIQELEEAQEQLIQQAHRDFLTGLYNRRYFYEIAQKFMKLYKREKKPLSIISIDIDKFKSINDTYGHAIGDEVLKKLAQILQDSMRESDVVARFGGEEFIVLLPFTDADGAYSVAEKLRINVETSVVPIDHERIIHFTISLGVASMQESDTKIDEVLDRADKVLYEAKRSGRNRAVLYHN